MKNILFIYVVLCSFISCASDSVVINDVSEDGNYLEGTIKTKSGLPVHGAEITIFADSRANTAITDEKGFYSVLVPDGDVKVLVNYKTKTVYDGATISSKELLENGLNLILSDNLLEGEIVTSDDSTEYQEKTDTLSGTTDSLDVKDSSDTMITEPVDFKTIKKYVPGGKDYTILGSFGTDTVFALVSPFYMDSTAVTVSEYFAVVDSSRRKHNPIPSNFNPQAPITSLSWFDAVYYCNEKSKALGLDTVYTYDYVLDLRGEFELANIVFHPEIGGVRLPTISEYTVAAAGGTNSTYFWGEDSLAYDDYSWVSENSELIALTKRELEVVGQKLPNAYGLYDMTGNGGEWCNDLYNRDSVESYYGKSEYTQDPVGPPADSEFMDASIMGIYSTSYQALYLNRMTLNVNWLAKNRDVTFRTVVPIKE